MHIVLVIAPSCLSQVVNNSYVHLLQTNHGIIATSYDEHEC